MSIAPNRAVAVLTPLVFAPLAGAISVAAAKHAGVEVDAQSLQAVFIAGATIALAKAGLWMKGWQDWEKRESTVEAAVDAAPDLEPDPDPDPVADADEGFDFDDDDLGDEIPDEDAVPAGV